MYKYVSTISYWRIKDLGFPHPTQYEAITVLHGNDVIFFYFCKYKWFKWNFYK